MALNANTKANATNSITKKPILLSLITHLVKTKISKTP
jgi:hypothetical protein